MCLRRGGGEWREIFHKDIHHKQFGEKKKKFLTWVIPKNVDQIDDSYFLLTSQFEKWKKEKFIYEWLK